MVAYIAFWSIVAGITGFIICKKKGYNTYLKIFATGMVLAVASSFLTGAITIMIDSKFKISEIPGYLAGAGIVTLYGTVIALPVVAFMALVFWFILKDK